MKRYVFSGAFFIILMILFSCSEEEKFAPEIILQAPEVARVNTPVIIDATQSRDKDGVIDETTFSFDFGDGSEKVTGVSKATHTYKKAGDYKVIVKVSDNDKNESVKSIMISIKDNLPPVASLMAPEKGRINTDVKFDGSKSTDTDGSIVKYSFDFGDGSEKVEGSTAVVYHKFTTAGIYNITLEVTDNEGAKSSVVQQIEIMDNVPPMAVLDMPDKGRINTDVKFDGSKSTDTDGSIVKYSFDFGDGSAKVEGSTAVVYHKFTTAGIYNITLEVTDNEGGKSSVVQQIEIMDNIPPVAQFTALSVTTELEIITADGSLSRDEDGSIVEYTFDFGDGSSPVNAVVANHVYTKAGEYKIKLVVKDNEGAESSIEKLITVNSLASQSTPPTARFTAPDKGRINVPVTFDGSMSESGSGRITEYKWDFGDGSAEVKGMESVVTHTFTSTGIFTVTLTVTSTLKDGITTLTDSVSKQIIISEEGIAVTKIEPSSGTSLGGTEVIITGSNFPSDGSVKVTFDYVNPALAVNVLDSTRIKLITPPNKPGTVDVLVESSKGSVVVSNGFTFYGEENYADTIYCPRLLVSGGTSLGVSSTDDDVNYTVKLPFDFEFFGTRYSKDTPIYISTNGWISFNNTPAQFTHYPIPSASNPATLIAPFFMDLKPGANGQIYTEVSGSEPNRVFTIAYRKFTSNSSPGDEYNFEVIMYESSNDIKFQYLNKYGGTLADGSAALIGIQDIQAGGVQASRNTSVRGLAPGGRVYVFKYERPNYQLQTDTTLSIYTHNPADGGNVSIFGNITIDFTKELNSNTVNSNITMTDLSNGLSVPITVNLSADKRRVTITTQNPLVVDRKYRINILTGLRGIDNSTFSFDPTKVSCGVVSGPTGYSFIVTARATVSQIFDLGAGSNPMQIKHLINSHFAYVAKSNGNRLEIIDTNGMYSYSSLSLQDCTTPRYLALSTDDKIGYVSCQNNRVAVVNLAPSNFYQIDTNSVTPGVQSINVGNQPAGVAIRNTNDRIYLANTNGNNVSVINTANYNVITTINVGNNPVGVAVNNVKNRLYVANSGSDSISVIDIAAGSPTENTVLNTINLTGCNNPDQIAVTPDGSKFLVTCSGNDRVALIDANTNNQLGTVNTHNRPIGIDITYDGRLAYVANYDSDSVTIINIASQSVSQTISIGNNTQPFFLTFIPNTYTALITLYNPDQIAVIK